MAMGPTELEVERVLKSDRSCEESNCIDLNINIVDNHNHNETCADMSWTSITSKTTYDNVVCPNCVYEQDDTKSPQLNIKEIFNLYEKHTDSATGTIITAGGLQQFLIKKERQQVQRDDTNRELYQPRMGDGSESQTFHDLPDSLQLHIFSLIPAETLCHIASVCKHWFMLTNDHLLWERKLHTDMKTWNIIGNTTNPLMYMDAGCHAKDIYTRCSPIVNKRLKEKAYNFHHISTVLRSLWPHKTPRLAMFGPGLESSTSCIVRRIIQDQIKPFNVIGMFPGQFEGVGSGFNMKMGNTSFNLSTLYTTCKKDRENMAHGERLRHSRLLAHNQPNGVEKEDGEEVEEKYELRQAVQDFSRTVDGFVFVVDASMDLKIIGYARAEIYAMVNELWSSVVTPVLILSCIPTSESTRVPSVDIVQKLKLQHLGRPWQVHECVAHTLDGLPEGLDWLIGQAHRR